MACDGSVACHEWKTCDELDETWQVLTHGLAKWPAPVSPVVARDSSPARSIPARSRSAILRGSPLVPSIHFPRHPRTLIYSLPFHSLQTLICSPILLYSQALLQPTQISETLRRTNAHPYLFRTYPYLLQKDLAYLLPHTHTEKTIKHEKTAVPTPSDTTTQ